MASPYEDLVAGGRAPVGQRLIVLTDDDRKVVLDALEVLAEEHLHTEVELGTINRLIERLS